MGDTRQASAANGTLQFCAIITPQKLWGLGICAWPDSGEAERELPGARKEHKDTIPLRLAACETIEESLYCGTVAQSGDQQFHPEMRSSVETTEALKELFR